MRPEGGNDIVSLFPGPSCEKHVVMGEEGTEDSIT